MSTEKELLLKRLAEIEGEIKETEKRIPYHSVKIGVMQDLFALEDERTDILKLLQER